MAAIQDPIIRGNLIYNYEVIFKRLLKEYSVLTRFQEEIDISKNKWYSTCQGKSYLENDHLLYEETLIDRKVIQGKEKMVVNIDSDSMDEEYVLKDIDTIINLYEDNPEEAEVVLNRDYSTNFRKLFKYVLSLTGKHPDRIVARLNTIAGSLDGISGSDYIGLDMELLRNFNNIIIKHMQLSSAAIKIKFYDK